MHASYTRQPNLAAKLIKDVIIEPYRAYLLPGFAAAHQAVDDMGAVAFGILGSGPTLFAICNSQGTAMRVVS